MVPFRNPGRLPPCQAGQKLWILIGGRRKYRYSVSLFAIYPAGPLRAFPIRHSVTAKTLMTRF